MFDKDKPYGEVWGIAPFNYVQDGKFYRLDGTEVTEEGEPIAEVATEVAGKGINVSQRNHNGNENKTRRSGSRRKR